VTRVTDCKLYLHAVSGSRAASAGRDICCGASSDPGRSVRQGCLKSLPGAHDVLSGSFGKFRRLAGEGKIRDPRRASAQVAPDAIRGYIVMHDSACVQRFEDGEVQRTNDAGDTSEGRNLIVASQPLASFGADRFGRLILISTGSSDAAWRP
jgi:hypothetical protein